MQLDFEKLAAGMLLPVKSYIEKTQAVVMEKFTALSERVARLEGREPSKDGKDADPEVIKRLVHEAISALPPAKDGNDGFGFDDIDVVYDGERSLTLRFAQGERSKEFSFKLPVAIYKGVFAQGDSYDRGDTVTWGGSCWIANEETQEQPGTAKGWQLAVKRGRDAKPASEGEAKSSQPVRVAFAKGTH